MVAYKSGYNAAASTGLSVQAGGTVMDKLSMGTAEPFPYGQVRAVGFRTGDLDEYPGDADWLTLTGGHATHNSNYIVTSGLNNVPVGTYVYLQGKSTDAHDEEITAWAWSVAGSGGVGVGVEDVTAQQTRFKADGKGKYEVAITATLADGTQDRSSFDVYAGRYIGAESCALCHSDSLMPDMATEDNPANLPEPGNMASIACATCHDPHASTEPFDKGTTDAPNIASYQLRLHGDVTMYNGATVDTGHSGRDRWAAGGGGRRAA